jgi:hypothetical protein
MAKAAYVLVKLKGTSKERGTQEKRKRKSESLMIEIRE